MRCLYRSIYNIAACVRKYRPTARTHACWCTSHNNR